MVLGKGLARGDLGISALPHNTPTYTHQHTPTWQHTPNTQLQQLSRAHSGNPTNLSSSAPQLPISHGPAAADRELNFTPSASSSFVLLQSSHQPTYDDLISTPPAPNGDNSSQPISFLQAWKIPGVVNFSLSLFFSKLIAYTFLYWLPYYLRACPIGGKRLTARTAGNLSILFDLGGVVGGAAAGWLSDRTRASALVSLSSLAACIPGLLAYRGLGHVSLVVNGLLMAICGFLVNGPYSLITTAVSADLGTHPDLGKNEKVRIWWAGGLLGSLARHMYTLPKHQPPQPTNQPTNQALATVTAIIDGCGSLGAALGPFLTGYLSESSGGFDSVFLMLYAAAAAAGALLLPLCWQEVCRPAGGGCRRLLCQVVSKILKLKPNVVNNPNHPQLAAKRQGAQPRAIELQERG